MCWNHENGEGTVWYGLCSSAPTPWWNTTPGLATDSRWTGCTMTEFPKYHESASLPALVLRQGTAIDSKQPV